MCSQGPLNIGVELVGRGKWWAWVPAARCRDVAPLPLGTLAHRLLAATLAPQAPACAVATGLCIPAIACIGTLLQLKNALPAITLHHFSLEAERDKALTEMNGHFLSNRPIRVSLATAKKNANTTTASAVQAPHPSGEVALECAPRGRPPLPLAAKLLPGRYCAWAN